MMRLNPKRVVLLAAASAGFLLSQEASHEQAGPLSDGGFLLNSGWRIKAEGLQIPVDTLPMASAISPDKKYLLVLK